MFTGSAAGYNLPLNVLRHPWRPVPLFRAALPFSAGIMAALYFTCNYVQGLLLAVSFLAVPALLIGLLSPKYFRRYVIQGFILQLIFCLQGYSAVLLLREDLRPDHYKGAVATWYRVRLEEDVSQKGKRLRAMVSVTMRGDTMYAFPSCGRLICYFNDDSLNRRLAYGDEILVKNRVTLIPLPDKAGDFNYRKFMERRQVYAKLNIRHYIPIAHGQKTTIRGLAIASKNKLIQLLKAHLEGQEFAVAAALLIGEDDYVDASLMTAFTATGTLHVLSVSGMHVGLIYMLLALVLGKLENKKYFRILYYLLLYGFLWSYAFITGLSAPVVRSAMMLSLVLSGKLIQRKSPVLNTLTGSFLLLMILNPYWITETGFQLSYLAVFGIMSMHPLLVIQIEFQQLWLHRIWELVSVSLCAQVITVPVGLYYFGQFPDYFLLSNLVIIPISTLAIYGGILVLVTSAIPCAGYWIAWAESKLIYLLNALTEFLGGLPGAVSYPGKISLLNCCLLYLILYAFIQWLQRKSAAALQYLLTVLIVWTLLLLAGL